MNLFHFRSGHSKKTLPKQDKPMGLPKAIQSLCPECRRVVHGKILEEEGRVVMRKKCPEHGEFWDLISPDPQLYLKAEKWAFTEGRGLENPMTEVKKGCPGDCGICGDHLSHAALVNVDLTNRCNLRCPICFANSNVQGYVAEPSFEEVSEILESLTRIRPVPPPAVQFAGGEPTLHPRFVDIVAKANQVGIEFIQVATNGIRFAHDPDFTRAAKEAGLHTAYLQFDGVTDEPYEKSRGVRNLLDVKRKAIDVCREAGIAVILVPTVVRGLNDHQVGGIVRFALENADVVDGISFQPVALTGRCSRDALEAARYTIYDLAHDVERQSGLLEARRDWYPLSITAPISRLLERITGKPTMAITCHGGCGMGTYLVVKRDTGEAVPITRVIDVEGLFLDLHHLLERPDFGISSLTGLQAHRIFKKHFRPEEAPEGFELKDLLEVIAAVTEAESPEWRATKNPWWLLMVMGMHFQDLYNFDLSRVRRCCIHYAAPDGKIYPFCTYNSGPVYRGAVEDAYVRGGARRTLETVSTP